MKIPKRILLNLLLSLFLLGIMNHSFAKEGESMLSKANKPFFSVRYDLAGCSYEIRINDVPVESNKEGLPLTSWSPADEWLQNGANTISIYLLPTANSNYLVKEGQDCEATVKFMVGNFDAPREDEVPITKIVYNSRANAISDDKANLDGSSKAGLFDSKNKFVASENGDVKVGDITFEKIKNKYGDGVKISRTINLKVLFPKWKWLTSDQIPNKEETKKELINQYQSLWNALNKKEVSKIKSLFGERTKEYKKAFYNKSDFDVASDMQKSSNNNGLQLGAFTPKYEYLEVFGNGRLARLTLWDGSEAIYFNYKDGSASINYDLIFRKQKGKWIITR